MMFYKDSCLTRIATTVLKHEKGTAFSQKLRALSIIVRFGKVSTEGRQHTKFSGQGHIIKLEMGKSP